MTTRHRVVLLGLLARLVSLPVHSGSAQEAGVQAPELRAQDWLNTTEPPDQLRLSRLTGHVIVLVFFMAHDPMSTVALEHARQLWEVYRHRKLRVFGVHSPPDGWKPRTPPRPAQGLDTMGDDDPGESGRRVDREVRNEHRRRLRAVESFISELRLPVPVLVDHDRALWDRFRNLAYPTFQVIDHHGLLRATYTGTRAYSQLSRQVDGLLQELAQAQDDQAQKAAAGPPVRP
ncbi:MAG: hypothetical protein HY710_08470 [Candidatus Latescibacteria bacterium]|nr:hypothetical protein [Candidatus Latescibacterota bacterium]